MFKIRVLFEYDTKEVFEAKAQHLEESSSTLPKIKELMVMAKVEGGDGVAILEV